MVRIIFTRCMQASGRPMQKQTWEGLTQPLHIQNIGLQEKYIQGYRNIRNWNWVDNLHFLPIFLATLTSRSRRAVLSSPIRVVVCRERRSEKLEKISKFWKAKKVLQKEAEKVILRNVAMLQACNALRVVEQTCEIFCKTCFAVCSKIFQTCLAKLS